MLSTVNLLLSISKKVFHTEDASITMNQTIFQKVVTARVVMVSLAFQLVALVAVLV
jgi:hypothetical protein